jgi:hypothetical protein
LKQKINGKGIHKPHPLNRCAHIEIFTQQANPKGFNETIFVQICSGQQDVAQRSPEFIPLSGWRQNKFWTPKVCNMFLTTTDFCSNQAVWSETTSSLGQN